MTPSRPRSRLVRELAWILLIKVILLSALWYAFFRPAERPVLDSRTVAQGLLDRSTVSPHPVAGPGDAPVSSSSRRKE